MPFKETNINNFYNLKFLIKYLEGHRGFIAGGVFKNILNQEEIKDIDIYFHNENDFSDAVNLFMTKLGKFKVGYKNKKVTSFIDKETGVRVELIRSLFGKPIDVISQFDFTVTKFTLFQSKRNMEIQNFLINELNSSDFASYTVIHQEDFFEHLHLKRLVIDNQIPFPVSTLERTYKYRGYGYQLCRESLVKLIVALRDFEPTGTISEAIAEGRYAGWD